MARLAPEVLAHLEWIGFVQPTGLVVSAPALAQAGVVLEQSDKEGQRRLQALALERRPTPDADPRPYLPSFERFAAEFLDWRWSPKGYAGGPAGAIPDEIVVNLPDYEETLRPSFAVRERDPEDGGAPWQLLACELETGQDLDQPVRGSGHLEASPHARLERLLRNTGAPAGLLFNGETLRLLSAPSGESSGWMDFRVAEMVQTAGRPIAGALRLLLSEQRLLAASRDKRLAALLEASRKFQNEVSERLAEQVLHALYELMRGLQAAHDASKGALLREVLAERPDDVYHGLLNVVLRLVFLLYAEERGMLPADETFVRHYSLAGLFERLREDAAQHPDTMDQRYGAWAQLLVLSRMIFDGAEHGELALPRRHGVLFDPQRFPFLEGRSSIGHRQAGERLEPPLVPDGTLYRALDKLLVLDGERLSYRALDVEQIGSVYETMMGFRIETATGTSLAIKAQKKHGAPTTIDLDALLAVAPAKRAKWVEERASRKLTKTVTGPLKDADSIEALHQALDRVVDRRATPDLAPRGGLVLQPSEARRKSGSHYTPRSLTEPIVRTTLRPILERLREEAGGPPAPEQILELKVCDPAMGSGAFLVEACRRLGEELIEAWEIHGAKPEIPPDEDEVIHARRLVAQRCLYGVDRNPVAVDLSKVSLWLATLARDHAFTFVDHALRHGDSLVGLSNEQIAARDWSKSAPIDSPAYRRLKAQVDRVTELRRQIREADESVQDSELRELLDDAKDAAAQVRTYGDLVVEAFFNGARPKERALCLQAASTVIASGDVAAERRRLDELRLEDPPLAPFHWELEFPEVFDRDSAGFDAFVGNPPFAGKNTIGSGNVEHYLDWLKAVHEGSHGNSDLVAHFFRRAFHLLRDGGTFGLIATNTIAQGDTRGTGLRWICQHRGTIYEARRRVKWPGQSAVVVSVVHVARGPWRDGFLLDGRRTDTITAYLFHRGGHDDPKSLKANAGQSFQGSIVLGMGFTFDDTDKKGVASTLDEMQGLIARDPRNQEVIFPYIGGDEVNDSPTHAHHRYVINFGEHSEEECLERWPELMAIVEERVKPDRMKNKRGIRKRHWWRFGETTPALFAAIAGLERVLVCPGGTGATKYLGFVFLDRGMVFSQTVCVFAFDCDAAFTLVQSRVHDVWARFFGSSLGDTLRYNSSDCFETFPFPQDWRTHPALEVAGRAYYDFRAGLMVQSDEGLTKTYNRFHDEGERDPEIERLRELHAAMDRAVLDAYGWSDIPMACEFLLDYEDEDDGATGSGRRKSRKKPWRYRWPDETRDEVLARLLELNAERARQEALSGAAGPTKGGRRRAARRSSGTGDLFS